MALLYTAFLIGSIAAIFMQELNYSQYARIVTAINIPAQFVSYVDDLFKLVAMLDTDAVVLNLVLKIPDVLFCLGLWLIFFMSGTKKQEMSGAGFLFGKIAVIVRMIIACVALIACLIISVAFLVASWVAALRAQKRPHAPQPSALPPRACCSTSRPHKRLCALPAKAVCHRA